VALAALIVEKQEVTRLQRDNFPVGNSDCSGARKRDGELLAWCRMKCIVPSRRRDENTPVVMEISFEIIKGCDGGAKSRSSNSISERRKWVSPSFPA